MSWLIELFLGKLKGFSDSTALEWERYHESYFCGVTWYPPLALCICCLNLYLMNMDHLACFLASFPPSLSATLRYPSCPCQSEDSGGCYVHWQFADTLYFTCAIFIFYWKIKLNLWKVKIAVTWTWWRWQRF